jgi:hypothetical protein
MFSSFVIEPQHCNSPSPTIIKISYHATMHKQPSQDFLSFDNTHAATDSQTFKKTAVKRATKKPLKTATLSKVIPQNKQKAMVKALDEKQVLFQKFNKILAAVSKDPTLWTKPEFQPLRDFDTMVIGNPQMFAHVLPEIVTRKRSWTVQPSTLHL